MAIMAGFFDWKGIVNHEVCTTWSDSKGIVMAGNFSAFEGCFAQEEA